VILVKKNTHRFWCYWISFDERSSIEVVFFLSCLEGRLGHENVFESKLILVFFLVISGCFDVRYRLFMFIGCLLSDFR
jgi:hypothetical protein